MVSKTYTLREASEMLGISTGILRRLCNAGLIRGVKRNRMGHRIFSDEQINFAHVLLGLKQCGFKTPELKRFSRLYYQGASTKKERKAILSTRRRQIWQEIEARQASIDFIERQEELLN